MKTIIIAEAGVNHNGDVLLAKELIDVAKDSGADYVKFQIFKSELLSTAEAKKAEYQRKHNIKPGSAEWFKLWFAQPGLTGENPMPKSK